MRGLIVILSIICSGCGPRVTLTEITKTEEVDQKADAEVQVKRTEGMEPQEDAVAQLKKLTLAQHGAGSLGGPYVGIVHNSVTRAVVAQGKKIVPQLVERLKSSGPDESAFIVFCLRELHAVSAKKKLVELQQAVRSGARFANEPHDLTLEMQIKFFLDDADSWDTDGP